MMFSASSRLIHAVWPAWTEADGRHFTNYLTFLLGVASFYAISRRLLSRRGALMATALFASQPLLFGQGFINQKDTPFMGFFLATLAAGLAAADSWHRSDGATLATSGSSLTVRWQDFLHRLRSSWCDQGVWFRRLLLTAVILTLLLAVDLLALGGLRQLARATIDAAYQGVAPTAIQGLFDRVATDAYKTPINLYFDKLDAGLRWIRWLAPAGMLAGLFLLSSWRLKPLGKAWGLNRTAWAQPWLIVSAVFLGFTLCVRQLGLFAGGLVGLAFIYRSQLRAAFPMIAYSLMAAAVTVITWPWLWPNPVGRFVQSFLLGVGFPAHRTFYRGGWISSSILPWHYFPTLASIELTVPAVILAIAGGLFAAWRLIKSDRRWFWIVWLGIWFGVPIVGLIGFNMTVYGNIRHLLFTLPPVLMIAGLALEWLIDHLPRRWLQATALALALGPGLWGIAVLHPYEYIYMNQFVGGVGGAEGRYELDRQCISLRGGIEYVNQVADPGDTVMVLRQTSQVVPNARPDLRLIDDRLPYRQADYVLACHWPDPVSLRGEGFELAHKVSADGATLTDVWKRP
jgi:hypothetical protein